MHSGDAQWAALPAAMSRRSSGTPGVPSECQMSAASNQPPAAPCRQRTVRRRTTQESEASLPRRHGRRADARSENVLLPLPPPPPPPALLSHTWKNSPATESVPRDVTAGCAAIVAGSGLAASGL